MVHMLHYIVQHNLVLSLLWYSDRSDSDIS